MSSAQGAGRMTPEADALAREQCAEQTRLHGKALGVLPLASGTVAGALVLWLWPDHPSTTLLGWLAMVGLTTLLRFAVYWASRAGIARDPSHPRWRLRHRVAIGLNGLSWALLWPVMDQLPDGPAHHAILFAVAAMLTGSVIANSFDLVATVVFAVPVSLPGLAHMAEHGDRMSWQESGLLALFSGVVVMAAVRGRRGFLAYVQRNLEARTATAQAQDGMARLERIGALAAIGPWELDATSGVLSCPPQTATALGIPASSTHTAQSLAAQLAPDSAVALSTALDATLHAGLPLRVEADFVRPDGRSGTLLFVGQPVLEAGQVLRVEGAVQDVTLLRQKDRALADHARLNEQLLQNTEQGIWFLDNSGLTTDVNAAMCRLLGRPREQVLGRAVLDFFTDADRAILDRQLELRKRGHKEGYEIGILRPDGSRVECFNNATPLYDGAGKKVGSVGMWTDLTAIKRAQDALVAAKEEAERASQAKSQFLSQMSHELRTPLNAILGFGQLLASDTQWPLNPPQQLKVQEILAGAEHLLNLINGLLDLSRIEAGRFAVDLQVIGLESLVHEALALMQPLAQRQGVHLPARWAAPRPGLTVQADRTRLMQVLLNLIGNAVKYNCRDGHVTLECRDSEDRVWLGVRDEGSGLSEEDQSRLFEPFQRLGAEHSNIEGTGIGLALSRRLVQAMGGQIGVDSTPGQGSTFWLRLPAGQGVAWPEQPAIDHGEGAAANCLSTQAAPEALTDSTARQTVLPDQGQRLDAEVQDGLHRTVLYIEDNPVNVMVMQAMVTRLPGLEMISAEDGGPGLEMALRERPDLILTDIQMPGMDGFELLRRLQQHEQTRHIPVIAISADALPDTVARGQAAGFADYLTKPVEMGALHAAIREALARPNPRTPG